MQIQRDDKAVRRIKPVVQPEVEVIPYEESLEVHLVEEREGVEERPMERR